MPGTEHYPFRRLSVDHMIRGETRVWWELDRYFQDPLPHQFQIQTGNTMNGNAADWVDVGSVITNGYYGIDDERRDGDYGKTLTTHYRVKLTTSRGSYVSAPVHTFGDLGEKDWVFSREIIRKETLRHQLVSVEGFLLRRMRFGARCTRCLDPLTGEILDSKCPECNGVGFIVGYHPPVPLSADMTPEAVIELLKATEPPGPSRPTDQQIRIKGFPTVAKHDVWVDSKSDQRWIFHNVLHLAEWRHVPLVIQISVKLLPFTDQIYKIDVGGEPGDSTQYLPKTGTGDTCIDHNYGGVDNLAYTNMHTGEGIDGAIVTVFSRANYDMGNRGASAMIAQTHTLANGRWATSLCLCAGTAYTVVFQSVGQFGPDACNITIPSVVTALSAISSPMGPQ